MMIRKLIFLIIGVFFAGSLFLLFRPAGMTGKGPMPSKTGMDAPLPQPAEKKAAYLLRKGLVVSGRPSLQFEQGDHVTLNVTSDRADSLHLHGYDLKLPLRPGIAVDLRFVADRTGRFTLESHHSHRELAIIEVYPRGYGH